MSVHSDLREVIAAAITRHDAPWRLNRTTVRNEITDAVMAHVHTALLAAHARGLDDADRQATDARIQGYDDGRARGYATGRRDAINEAATMLKRHGHRTAVDRVQALATPPVDTDTGQAPADAPRPSPGPQKGTPAPGLPGLALTAAQKLDALASATALEDRLRDKQVRRA